MKQPPTILEGRKKYTFKSSVDGISVPVTANSLEEAIILARKIDPSINFSHLWSEGDVLVEPRDGRKNIGDHDQNLIPGRDGRSSSHVVGTEPVSPEKPRRIIPQREGRKAGWFKESPGANVGEVRRVSPREGRKLT